MKLKDKISLITGSAQGIGEAIVNKFSEEGSTVILCDIQVDKIKNVAHRIKKKGGEASFFKADVSSPKEVSKLFNFIKEKYHRLDILVNNAAISPKQRFDDITYEDWDKVLAVNLRSVFLCTKEAISIMKKEGKGKIVNISSMAGQNGGIFGSPHYAASKAGVIGFTKAMAKNMGPFNINVNAIAPGRIVTPLYYKDISPEMNEAFNKQIPLGRPGKPDEVVEGALFLASDSSNYITGTTLSINGGCYFNS